MCGRVGGLFTAGGNFDKFAWRLAGKSSFHELHGDVVDRDAAAGLAFVSTVVGVTVKNGGDRVTVDQLFSKRLQPRKGRDLGPPPMTVPAIGA